MPRQLGDSSEAVPVAFAAAQLSKVYNRWRAVLFTSMMMLLPGLGPLGAAPAGSATEYELKALFLFHFTQFVKWPPQALPISGAPLSICVLGSDPFGSYLDDVLHGEDINGHPLKAVRHHDINLATECQVLFISTSEEPHLQEIVQQLKGRSVLTVGESPGFIESGGMIRFLMVNNKIRLRINAAAARAASLSISSKLLRPAEVLDSEAG